MAPKPVAPKLVDASAAGGGDESRGEAEAEEEEVADADDADMGDLFGERAIFSLDDAGFAEPFEVDDATDEEALEGDTDEFRAKVDEAMKRSSSLCFFCRIYPRKKAQVFCAQGCEGDVREALRDAKSQGGAHYKSFCALREKGGATNC